MFKSKLEKRLQRQRAKRRLTKQRAKEQAHKELVLQAQEDLEHEPRDSLFPDLLAQRVLELKLKRDLNLSDEIIDNIDDGPSTSTSSLSSVSSEEKDLEQGACHGHVSNTDSRRQSEAVSVGNQTSRGPKPVQLPTGERNLVHCEPLGTERPTTSTATPRTSLFKPSGTSTEPCRLVRWPARRHTTH